MSPEQRKGRGVTARSDMWSFGVLVAEAAIFPRRLSIGSGVGGDGSGVRVREEVMRVLKGCEAGSLGRSVVDVVEVCLVEERKARVSSRDVVELLLTACESGGDSGVREWAAAAEETKDGSAAGAGGSLSLGYARWFGSGGGRDAGKACSLYEGLVSAASGGGSSSEAKAKELSLRLEYCVALSGMGVEGVERGVRELRQCLSLASSASERVSVWLRLCMESLSAGVLESALSGDDGGELGSVSAARRLAAASCRNEAEGVAEAVVRWMRRSLSEGEAREAVSDGEALFGAACRGHAGVCIEVLDCGAEVNKLWNGQSALWGAALDGRVGAAEALVSRGADVNLAKTSDGSSPLFVACENGHSEMVSVLLCHGADVHQSSHVGFFPLFMASQNGHVDIVEVLLKKGADVKQRKKNKATALMIAAENGHLDVIEVLVGAGAEVDAVDHQGKTALMFAAWDGHVHVIDYLLDHGADMHVVSSLGANALGYAEHFNQPKAAEYLISRGAVPAPPPQAAPAEPLAAAEGKEKGGWCVVM